MEPNEPNQCHRLGKWQRTVLLSGLALTAMVLSAGTYMIYDLSRANPQLRFNNPRELISDYRFLLEMRYNKAKVRRELYNQEKETARRVKEAKPLKEARTPKVILNGKDKKPVHPQPYHLTWLMAYPFAGSTVALRIVQDATGYSMGTNYGDAVDTNRGLVRDMYPSDSVDGVPNGPYKYSLDKPLPPTGAGNVLVKTHCSGYCIDNGGLDCALKDYVTPLNEVKDFFLSCAAGTSFDGHHDVPVQYNPWKIESVMVLVRHPLEILVARYRDIATANSGYDKRLTLDADGIAYWCNKYDNQKGSIRLLNWLGDQRDLIKDKDIPCHSELYRIVMFYNQAFRTVFYQEEEYHIVHFEDYETDLGGTLQGIYDFLGYRMKENARHGAGARVFQRFNENDEPWFTEEQIDNMMEFVRSLAKWDETKEIFSSYE